MHNNIMAAGSKDRPPMLGPGRYSQWRSRFLWYIDTKPNGGGLKKSILSGPYVPTTVQVQAVEAAEGRPAVPQHTSVETILNMTPENKEHTFIKAVWNQRTMTVAGARETVGSPVVQQPGIQCFNCKGYGHYAKECRKPKRVKDYAYHKEKMMMCKQAEQGVPLQADWLEDTDEEIDE
ncbi:retrovirus-related pol polyprotein from transposon TNT 1-94 [Tanacetum coccineum]